MKSALAANAHSRKRLSGSWRMTWRSVSGWQSWQLFTISAMKSGRSPSILLNHGRAGPSLDQSCAREFENESRRIVLAGEVGELEDTGIKNDSQGRAWHDAERARAASFRQMQGLP